MPRNVSATAKQAIFAQETGEAFLLLLTIGHPVLVAPIRVVNNLQDVVSRGNLYLAFPFEIALPEERDDQLARVTLTIDNIDRQIAQAVRQMTSPPTVTLEVVLASSPDTVEAGPFAFTLREVEYDALVVTGQLVFEDVLNEGFPAHSFTPNLFPAVF